MEVNAAEIHSSAGLNSLQMYLQFTEEVQVVESVGLNLTDVVHTEIPKTRRKERETERLTAMAIISVSDIQCHIFLQKSGNIH